MLRFLCALMAVAFLPLPGLAVTLTGRVVGVHDSDTITVLDAGETQYEIRQVGFNAAKHYQGFGTSSRKNLSSIVFGKTHPVSQTRNSYCTVTGL